MAKVITLSRTFPPYHPRKGERTDFPLKVLRSLLPLCASIWDVERITEIAPNLDTELSVFWQSGNYPAKHHTIRAGRRFKTGDMASLRIWSARPYNSPQIIVAPDVQVKVFDLEIDMAGVISVNGFYIDQDEECSGSDILAKNDGLSYEDLYNWFKPAYKKADFIGQIICWNPEISY